MAPPGSQGQHPNLIPLHRGVQAAAGALGGGPGRLVKGPKAPPQRPHPSMLAGPPRETWKRPELLPGWVCGAVVRHARSKHTRGWGSDAWQAGDWGIIRQSKTCEGSLGVGARQQARSARRRGVPPQLQPGCAVCKVGGYRSATSGTPEGPGRRQGRGCAAAARRPHSAPRRASRPGAAAWRRGARQGRRRARPRVCQPA